ncbi:ATP-dependent DNA helicase RRM3-like protein [Tanacetum coccineum]
MLIDTHLKDDPLNTLIDFVYLDIQLESANTSGTLNRAILTTKNSFVDEISEILIARFPGEEIEYIAFGDIAGRELFIHRIPLQPPTDEQYTVPFKRLQFPIRLCFAMTINKAQGQTLDHVGVYLKEPAFSHGQLYVALSRARTASHAIVLIQPPFFDAPNIRETKTLSIEKYGKVTTTSISTY